MTEEKWPKIQKTRYAGIQKHTQRSGRVSYRAHVRVRGRQTAPTFPTLAEAVRFKAEATTPSGANRLLRLERGRITLEEHYAQWVGYHKKLSMSTRGRYKGILSNYVAGTWIGRVPIAELTRDDFRERISELMEMDLNPATIKRMHASVQASLNQALDDEKILGNPARGIDLPELLEFEPFFLSREHVEALVARSPDPYKVMMRFLPYTGLRMGEAVALRVRHINRDAGLVNVVENAPEAARGFGSVLPKSKKKRQVPLPASIAEDLFRQLEERGQKLSDGTVDPDGLVFRTARRHQIRQSNWRDRVFLPTAKSAGVMHERSGKTIYPRPHDLRHTFASIAAEEGYTLQEVTRMMGHSSSQITDKYYLHLFPETNRDKANALDAALLKAKRAYEDTVVEFVR